jgi:6-phosphogluconolactonase
MNIESSVHAVVIANGREEHARQAAELCARGITSAVDERAVARVALSGGATPSEAYQYLSSLALPWDRVHWFWVDERAVAPDHPRSNYSAAARDLKLADGAHGKVHRMEGEASDLTAAAAAYETLLRRTFGVASAVAFDVLIAGIGDDGHTASLFPDTGAVKINDRLVAAIPEQKDKGLEARLTLTAPVIQEARLVLVLARGENKKEVVVLARQEGSEDRVPARILQQVKVKGRVVWVLDKDAAG